MEYIPQPGHALAPGNNRKDLFLGLDIGSTTIKAVILDKGGNSLFSDYQRHYSHIRECLLKILTQIADVFSSCAFTAAVTGSGGLSLASELGAPFIQEVLACNLAISRRIPDADVIVELGGEDAKITYLTGGLEQRMNETCAGGTGAFIDQMAAFTGADAASLDRLALAGKTIYPIASRCGVFAKSDILPLLNEGCAKTDIAASIMQAVCGQTISGLAQGRPIRGKVVFLGGPLRFLASLRERFRQSLKGVSEAVFPPDGHYFVALGAALYSLASGKALDLAGAIEILAGSAPKKANTALPPLFRDEDELLIFKKRHECAMPAGMPLEEACGSAWLGIDSGSTTLKAVLIDGAGRLLYQWYGSSQGDPLGRSIAVLKDIYSRINPGLVIRGSCATGYGSALISHALGIDEDEVETVAHFEAAAFFDPAVSFILDIGGQDIKCLHIRSGAIYRIGLNEACSAGCGSFIENFAGSLNIDLQQFVAKACLAPAPVDLGTRCTVFMNSRVRQAQKEGATLDDIAAGLCWSVIRNAIFKVMKIGSPEELGGNIVVQGGAFYNDALLRALELEIGKNVKRPPIAGLMGAFGAALIAARRRPSGSARLISHKDLADFRSDAVNTRCAKCANACLLTITRFSDGRRFVSGNRCERGAGTQKQELPNIPAWKQKRLFSYEPLAANKARRGIIGIPRSLNIYENYPLWFTLFTDLGFRVELSAPSSREQYYAAFDTIPSQTVCYPAKLAHGHMLDLIKRGIKNIFYPCVKREQSDAGFLHGTHNCPVVTSYPELLALNMRHLLGPDINYVHTFLPLDRAALPGRLAAIPMFSGISIDELTEAAEAGFSELENYRRDLRMAGENALARLQGTGLPGVILAGHPYHIDPEVNHGIPDIINSCGMGVLTEDCVAHLSADSGNLRVVDQWAYHSRLYQAGAFAAKASDLGVIQLISFGCGLDAVTADQLEEIVERNGRLYAQIKVDEGSNPGPARIRIRSLLAAMKARKERETHRQACLASQPLNPGESWPVFLPAMKSTHTLLVPQMSPLHFQFARQIFASEGYDAVLLEQLGHDAIDFGLRYVNNDACYPAIVVIGQLLEAVKSGKYDPDKIALVISQTGGGCRATNYIGFLRRALKSAGLEKIPIANFSATGRGPGIRLTPRMLGRMIMAGHYGDAMMRTLHRLRPYEKEPGSVETLVRKWSAKAAANIESGNLFTFQKNMFAMIGEFDRLPINESERRPRIGLVGEILLKYHPQANNHAARIIEEEGGEAIVTDIMDFMLYGMYEHIFNYENLTGSRKSWLLARAGIAWQELTRLSLRLALRKSRRFTRSARFSDLRSSAKKLISLGHQTGEGWLLAAEMIKMLESGVKGILCMQPFGCLPNHIVGKGLIRELKRRYPDAVIMPLDYDPGASETNQINRIKLMMRAGIKDK